MTRPTPRPDCCHSRTCVVLPSSSRSNTRCDMWVRSWIEASLSLYERSGVKSNAVVLLMPHFWMPSASASSESQSCMLTAKGKWEGGARQS